MLLIIFGHNRLGAQRGIAGIGIMPRDIALLKKSSEEQEGVSRRATTMPYIAASKETREKREVVRPMAAMRA